MEKELAFWTEQRLEVAKMIFQKAVTMQDVPSTFDPVRYAIDESDRFIREFKKTFKIY